MFGISNNEPWIRFASCQSIGVDVFYPEPGEDWMPTASLCRTRCPVAAQCLDYAMRLEQGSDRNRRFGIFGGLTPTARMNHEPTWLAEREVAA